MSMDKFKDQVLRVGQQASFAVQMKGKKGTISASVNSPSGQSIECSVAELDEGWCCLFLFIFTNLYYFYYCNSFSCCCFFCTLFVLTLILCIFFKEVS